MSDVTIVETPEPEATEPSSEAVEAVAEATADAAEATSEAAVEVAQVEAEAACDIAETAADVEHHRIDAAAEIHSQDYQECQTQITNLRADLTSGLSTLETKVQSILATLGEMRNPSQGEGDTELVNPQSVQEPPPEPVRQKPRHKWI